MTSTDAAAGGWSIPTFPYELRDEPTLTEVPDAALTRVRRGELRTLEVPTRWLTGAVHQADGALVVSSQKIGGLLGNQAAMADPSRMRVPPDTRRLEGTWLYGGHWIQHFGHFFTETLTTLWPRGLQVDGLVFHSYMSVFAGIKPWQDELLALTEYAGLPVEIIEGEPLRAERLLVPGRSVVANGWAHPQASDVWRRMADAADLTTTLDPDGERIFLTRTGHNRTVRDRGRERRVRTDPGHDAALDRVFADAGFRVVAPEELPVREQLEVAAGASVLAGGAGSALHLSAFAPAGVRVIELGDSRSPTWQVPMQRVIDRLCDHPTAFVPHDVPPEQLPGELDRLGVGG